jgi:hypothetical protein
MTKTILALAFILPAMQNGGGAAKELIANKRVTVREVANSSAQIGSPDHDLVAVDLDGKTALFVAKGARRASPKHAIVVELNDVSSPPVPNTTKYPLAFPRPGIKKLIDNNRVFVWDYTWTQGKPTPMHFHDKDVVVVYLADGQLKSTTPDGKSVVNDVSFGLTRFNAPNRTHYEELVKGSARAIIVELK